MNDKAVVNTKNICQIYMIELSNLHFYIPNI